MSSGAALLTLLVCGKAELCSESRPAFTRLGKQRGSVGKKQVGVCFLGLQPLRCEALWLGRPNAAERSTKMYAGMLLVLTATAGTSGSAREVSVTAFPGHLCLSRADPSPRGQALSAVPLFLGRAGSAAAHLQQPGMACLPASCSLRAVWCGMVPPQQPFSVAPWWCW